MLRVHGTQRMNALTKRVCNFAMSRRIRVPKIIFETVGLIEQVILIKRLLLFESTRSSKPNQTDSKRVR